LDVEAEQVYKTIVFVDGQHNHYVFCVPAQFSVNLKKARALTGQRDLAPIKVSQLKEVTGYIRGGCSPIGMKRPYPTYIDELCQLEEVLYISAGERGQQICLKPQDLIDICNATLADVT
jgi:Cys-tRNA(Pro)/Cys-tRNA(Cys) deacylase